MLHSKSLVMILFALLATAPFQIVTGAAIVSTLSPRLPHPVGIMEYTGIINGREVQLNGTVQEIRSQIQTLYPELNHLNSVAATREISTVEPRSKSTLNCLPIGNWGWTGAYQFPIVQSIAFLNNIPGSEQQSACYVGAGPATCVRIACLDNSGIWLCNDNDYAIHPSCNYLSSYALDIVNSCSWASGGVEYTGGQEFDTDNYNVIVHSTSC